MTLILFTNYTKRCINDLNVDITTRYHHFIYLNLLNNKQWLFNYSHTQTNIKVNPVITMNPLIYYTNQGQKVVHKNVS